MIAHLENKNENLSKVDGPIIKVSSWARIWHRLRQSNPYTHDRIIQDFARRLLGNSNLLNSQLSGNVRFFLRVDDFPRWDIPVKNFCKFDSILKDCEIQYCLGVTPCLAENPFNPESPIRSKLNRQEIDILLSIKHRVDIALHGLTHKIISSKNYSEFINLQPDEINNALFKGLALLNELSIKPAIFIPPFNRIKSSAIPIISRYFEVLCGGPESLDYLGFRSSPSFIYGMIYLPSYPPAYGRAKDMYNFVKRLKQMQLPIIIPLTIHWAWEERDNFQAFEKLCKELIGWTISINKITAFGTDIGDFINGARQ